MKTTLLFFLIAWLCTFTINSSQTGAKKISVGRGKTGGKVVVQQFCKSSATKTEITSLKKKVEAMNKVLTHRLDKIDRCRKDSKDPWVKMNTAPVCFGARHNRFGKFLIPFSGKVASLKLVHVYGYVSCNTNHLVHWSYWGCGKNGVGIVVTTSPGRRVLFPSSQFITKNKWSLVPGYSSLSSELVLSAFSNPPSVTRGQELRLWYSEDLVDYSEADNGGISCCDIYARFI